MRVVKSLQGAFLLVSCFLWGAPDSYAANARPFWTEKSSYVEGDTLYCIGVVTQAKSPEVGRQTAYDNGKKEVSNFAQITDLSGVAIETQMTYEEQNVDGTYNVFRLLIVDMGELTKWKTRLLAKAAEEIEKQNQATALEIGKKKRQVEILQQQAIELEDLSARSKRVQDRIDKFNSDVKKLLRCGMTEDEVIGLLGRPRARKSPYNPVLSLNYGTEWLHFSSGILAGISEDPDTYYSNSCP